MEHRLVRCGDLVQRSYKETAPTQDIGNRAVQELFAGQSQYPWGPRFQAHAAAHTLQRQ
jgi:hypothetical protein